MEIRLLYLEVLVGEEGMVPSLARVTEAAGPRVEDGGPQVEPLSPGPERPECHLPASALCAAHWRSASSLPGRFRG